MRYALYEINRASPQRPRIVTDGHHRRHQRGAPSGKETGDGGKTRDNSGGVEKWQRIVNSNAEDGRFEYEHSAHHHHAPSSHAVHRHLESVAQHESENIASN